MAVTKIRKVSSWTLLICSIVSVITLLMFYFGGVVDPSAEMKEPVYTGLLLYWTYVLFALTIVVTLLLMVWQFSNSLKVDPRGALIGFAAVAFLALILIVTYVMGDGTALPGLNADSQVYNTPFWLKISDMWIYSSYVLIVLIVIAVVWGVCKKMMSR